MRLFFFPGSCALAAHIALYESGLKFESEVVDRQTRRTASGADFYAINPNGYVPALELDNGEILTESVAVLTYIGAQAADKQLAPVLGSLEYYRSLEFLTFISSEIYKNFAVLFRPNVEETRQAARDILALRLDLVERQLANRQYVLGSQFTVADAYLFTTLFSGRFVGVDLGRWPGLKAYMERLQGRPSVQSALLLHGLGKVL